jgi:hypothetical protein
LRRLGVSCPKNHNPADFFIQLLAIVPSQELCSFETIDTVCEAYEESQYKNDMMQHQKQMIIAGKVSARRYAENEYSEQAHEDGSTALTKIFPT